LGRWRRRRWPGRPGRAAASCMAAVAGARLVRHNPRDRRGRGWMPPDLRAEDLAVFGQFEHLPTHQRRAAQQPRNVSNHFAVTGSFPSRFRESAKNVFTARFDHSQVAFLGSASRCGGIARSPASGELRSWTIDGSGAWWSAASSISNCGRTYLHHIILDLHYVSIMPTHKLCLRPKIFLFTQYNTTHRCSRVFDISIPSLPLRSAGLRSLGPLPL
jgi:hypothetical protein